MLSSFSSSQFLLMKCGSELQHHKTCENLSSLGFVPRNCITSFLNWIGVIKIYLQDLSSIPLIIYRSIKKKYDFRERYKRGTGDLTNVSLSTQVQAKNVEMLGFFPFSQHSLNSIFHSKAFEPYGVVSYHQELFFSHHPPSTLLYPISLLSGC